MAAELRISCSCVHAYSFITMAEITARIFFKRKETFLVGLSAFGSDRSNFSFATSASMYCENKHTCWAGGNFFVVNIATEVNGD